MRDMVDALVEFAYEAEQDDELTLKIGDVIKNVVQSDGGWWEGELNGKKGLFPENFVKVIKPDDKSKPAGVAKKEAPQRKSVRELASKFKDNVHLGPLPPKKKEKRRKCKVMFEYTPEHEDELELKEGEVFDFVKEVEDGWWEGCKNGKSGVFPSNFVELCEEVEEAPIAEAPEKQAGSGDETVASVTEIKGKKVIGVGLGNIFQGGPIKLRSAKKDGPPTEPKKPPDVKEPAKPPPSEPFKPPPPEPAKPPPYTEGARPPIPDHTEVVKREKKVNRAVVRFSYAAEQPDELSLKEGETISVLDMHLEDEGWWKGEVNGKVGVFPDNFVELLPEEPPKPKKPPPPSVSTIPKVPASGGSVKTGIYPKLPDKAPAADPVIQESKKHDAKHKIEAPSLKNKEVSAPAKGFHYQKQTNGSNDRVVPPATAAKKPFVPPPVGKKPPPPKPDPPKPAETVKVEPRPVVPATKDVKGREIRDEFVEEKEGTADSDQEANFESLEPTSQKLIHLTASRAKGPKKRPPSTIFNLTDNEPTDSQDIDDVTSSTPPAVPAVPPPLHNDKHHVPHRDIKQSVPDIEKKSGHHAVEHTNHHHNAVAPPRPPEPAHGVSHGVPHSVPHGVPHGAAPSVKVVEELHKELRDLRAQTVTRSMFSELKTDYEKLKHEMETFKSSTTKKIRELMMEVDEEKKLRLNTQVEIERIKKLLAETNV